MPFCGCTFSLLVNRLTCAPAVRERAIQMALDLEPLRMTNERTENYSMIEAYFRGHRAALGIFLQRVG